MKRIYIALWLSLVVAGCGKDGESKGGGGGAADLSDPKTLAKINCDVAALGGEDPDKLLALYKKHGLGDDNMAGAKKLTELVAELQKDEKKGETYRNAFLDCLK